LSLFCLVLSILPFIAGGNKISLDLPNDRFMIALAFPSCLLLISLLEILFKKGIVVTGVFILFLSLSVGFQFNLSGSYKNALTVERNFFWQLFWRIPDLESHTIMVSQQLDTPYFSENHLTAALNLLYAPDNQSVEVPYAVAYIDGRIRDNFVTYKPEKLFIYVIVFFA